MPGHVSGYSASRSAPRSRRPSGRPASAMSAYPNKGHEFGEPGDYHSSKLPPPGASRFRDRAMCRLPAPDRLSCAMQREVPMVRSIFVPVVPVFIAVVAGACGSPPAPSPVDGGTSPCAVVLCAPGSVCAVQPDGSPRCVQPPAARPCFKTGCSGTVCADEPRVTTCEFRPEYACYQTATCERDAATGACGFRRTPELISCLEGYR
jgi:hypothetical protein